MEVRKKEPSDDDRVAEIVALATTELRQIYRRVPTERGLAAVDGGNVSSSLVAVDEEVLIGVVECCTPPDTAALHVRGLAVHPDWRRRGIARALLIAAADTASREGKTRLTLNTIKETGNQNVFAKLGFRVIREAPADHFEGIGGHGVTVVEMCRELFQGASVNPTSDE